MPNTEIPFKFSCPVEIWKKAGAGDQELRISGFVSTDKLDRQSEKVLQDGLNFSEFMDHGWFNDNHSTETCNILGYPTSIERRNKGFREGHYVEGYLIPDHEPSLKLLKLANSLKKTPRKLGFSIEGEVIRRSGPSGGTIVEAVVRNIAITNCPVNSDTGLEVLSKSLATLARGEDPDLQRSMTAGSDISDPGSSRGEGFPLRAESLEGQQAPKRKRRRKRRQKLSKGDAVEFLRDRYTGITKANAHQILDYISSQKEA